MGEDPRFIARRLAILASEDVGMADPMAIVVASAAAQAVELVGLPEAALNLSHAVIHLSLAPKSNTSAAAIWQAQEAVRTGPFAAVPPHLRGAGYYGASAIGSGIGYEYPHDDPRGYVEQQYLPEELAGRRFYVPGDHGAEGPLARRWRERRQEPPERPSRRPGRRRATDAGVSGSTAGRPPLWSVARLVPVGVC